MSSYVSAREIDELEKMMIEKQEQLSHREPIHSCEDLICASAKESIAWLRSHIGTHFGNSYATNTMLVAVAGIQFVQSAMSSKLSLVQSHSDIPAAAG
jgi:hypothetical protein